MVWGDYSICSWDTLASMRNWNRFTLCRHLACFVVGMNVSPTVLTTLGLGFGVGGLALLGHCGNGVPSVRRQYECDVWAIVHHRE